MTKLNIYQHTQHIPAFQTKKPKPHKTGHPRLVTSSVRQLDARFRDNILRLWAEGLGAGYLPPFLCWWRFNLCWIIGQTRKGSLHEATLRPLTMFWMSRTFFFQNETPGTITAAPPQAEGLNLHYPTEVVYYGEHPLNSLLWIGRFVG